MADTILVIAEQREGKLNRVSMETIAAAQAIAAETGATVEAAVFGSGIAGIGQEIAAKKLAKVTVIDSPKLAKYEPDGVVAALKDFIGQKKPALVLMPHTYQVRDFAPQLATALQRTLIVTPPASAKTVTSWCSRARCSRANSLPTSPLPVPLRILSPSRPALSVATKLKPAHRLHLWKP